jgi:hypothetical protein
MTNVVDLFTRQPSAATQYTPEELARYARQHTGPDFEKRRGKMVITSETQAATAELFGRFGLGIRTDGDPELQINTWAWIAGKVATELEWYIESPDFYFPTLVLKRQPPDFVRYVQALIAGDLAAASEAAKAFGAFDGLPDDHPHVRSMDIGPG